MYYGYELFDPRTDTVRYVGITNNLLRRYYQHLTCKGDNEAKNQWVKELSQDGLIPYIKVAFVVETQEKALELEKGRVNHHTKLGVSLFNKWTVVTPQTQDIPRKVYSPKYIQIFFSPTYHAVIMAWIANKHVGLTENAFYPPFDRRGPFLCPREGLLVLELIIYREELENKLISTLKGLEDASVINHYMLFESEDDFMYHKMPKEHSPKECYPSFAHI